MGSNFHAIHMDDKAVSRPRTLVTSSFAAAADGEEGDAGSEYGGAADGKRGPGLG